MRSLTKVEMDKGVKPQNLSLLFLDRTIAEVEMTRGNEKDKIERQQVRERESKKARESK